MYTYSTTNLKYEKIQIITDLYVVAAFSETFSLYIVAVFG